MTRSLPLGPVTTGLALVVLIVAALAALQGTHTPPANGVARAGPAPQSALAETLDRCRLAGPEGAADPACRSAWAESRNRFFSSSLTETSDE